MGESRVLYRTAGCASPSGARRQVGPAHHPASACPCGRAHGAPSVRRNVTTDEELGAVKHFGHRVFRGDDLELALCRRQAGHGPTVGGGAPPPTVALHGVVQGRWRLCVVGGGRGVWVWVSVAPLHRRTGTAFESGPRAAPPAPPASCSLAALVPGARGRSTAQHSAAQHRVAQRSAAQPGRARWAWSATAACWCGAWHQGMGHGVQRLPPCGRPEAGRRRDPRRYCAQGHGGHHGVAFCGFWSSERFLCVLARWEEGCGQRCVPDVDSQMEKGDPAGNISTRRPYVRWNPRKASFQVRQLVCLPRPRVKIGTLAAKEKMCLCLCLCLCVRP